MYSGAVDRNGWHLDRDQAEAAEADASTRSFPRSFQWHFTETILEKNVFLWNAIWRFMAIYGDLWQFMVMVIYGEFICNDLW